MCVQIRRIVTTAAIPPDNKTLILNPRFREYTQINSSSRLQPECSIKNDWDETPCHSDNRSENIIFTIVTKKWFSRKCILHILLSALRRYYSVIYWVLAFIALCQLSRSIIRTPGRIVNHFFVYRLNRIRRGTASITNFTIHFRHIKQNSL